MFMLNICSIFPCSYLLYFSHSNSKKQSVKIGITICSKFAEARQAQWQTNTMCNMALSIYLTCGMGKMWEKEDNCMVEWTVGEEKEIPLHLYIDSCTFYKFLFHCFICCLIPYFGVRERERERLRVHTVPAGFSSCAMSLCLGALNKW